VVPMASVAVASLGNWDLVFMITAAVNAIAALMAIFVLKPMRTRFVAGAAAQAAAEPASAKVTG
jgi:MFS transporter, OFA family, oxalate/formate antiporter